MLEVSNMCKGIIPITHYTEKYFNVAVCNRVNET